MIGSLKKPKHTSVGVCLRWKLKRFVTLKKKKASWFNKQNSIAQCHYWHWVIEAPQVQTERKASAGRGGTISNGTTNKTLFFLPFSPSHTYSTLYLVNKKEREREKKRRRTGCIKIKSKADGQDNRADTDDFLQWRQQFRLRGTVVLFFFSFFCTRAVDQFFYRRSRPPAADTVDCFV